MHKKAGFSSQSKPHVSAGTPEDAYLLVLDVIRQLKSEQTLGRIQVLDSGLHFHDSCEALSSPLSCCSAGLVVAGSHRVHASLS